METKSWIIIAIASAALIAITTTVLVDHFHRPTLTKGHLYDAETIDYHHKIKQIAQEHNQKESTWKAGHNKRWDNMGIEAIKAQMGVIQDPKYKKKFDTIKTEVADNIPDNFDSREAWPNCDSIKEVRDQANCGSCWAFGAVEAMSDRICIASGQKQQVRLSAQDMVTCCGSCGMGCDGGDPGSAWDWYKTNGVVTGDLYGDNTYCQPYSLKPCDHHVSGKYGPCPQSVPTPACKKECNSSYSTDYKTDKHFASDAYGIDSSVEAIQTEIMKNGPIEVAFTVYEDFLTYKSGVYQHTSGSELGGHAVKMIGWGTEDGTPYWLVVNSWNEGWGDKGTFKILRGKDECGIESECVAGTPKV
jgi:cathepsin B